MPASSHDPPDLALIREARETRARAGLGGVFYILAAALSIAANVAAQRGWVLDLAATAVFLLLGALRLYVAHGDLETARQAQRSIARMWAVILMTAMAWGAYSTWQVGHTPNTDAADLAWMCSVAFCTAMAHAFSMRWVWAGLAILLMYVPMLGASLSTAPGWAQPAAMTIYLGYLFLVLARSNAEYRANESLDHQLREQRDLFERQSRRDPLTDVYNRRRFQSELDRFIAQVAIAPSQFALLLVDIDHFKSVNDRFGHAAGDACLVHFARQLQAVFAGPGELVARLGGEEFGVLLPHTGEHEARSRAETLRILVANESVLVGEHQIGLTCSIGVSVADSDGAQRSTAIALYRAADAALYQAKDAGRNRVQVQSAPG